jgi:hypothetical protein
LTDESQIMKCHQCGADKSVFKLSPANINDKLKLVCSDCWQKAVETSRAMIYPREELTAFSEFKSDDTDEESQDVLDSKLTG